MGDHVLINVDNIFVEKFSDRMECDLLDIEQSTFDIGDIVCEKTVIYLYPETKTEVMVNLDLSGELTCTYPLYNNGWKVTAEPDGNLTDEEGKAYD